MKEQVPERGGLDGVFPYSREYVNVVLDEEGVIEVSLGDLATSGVDYDSYETDKDKFIEKTDHILSVAGIEPANWKQYVEMVTTDHGEAISGRRLQATPLDGEKSTAGGYLHHKVFYDMPMEDEDFGKGGSGILMHSDDEIALHLTATGDYWRDRKYKHPVYGYVVTLRENGENTHTDIWDHGVEPEYLGCEDHHNIMFRAVIERQESAQIAA